ncbi:MAG: sulfatase [bacterium]|nr:sulfatase [bacterium]
MGTDGSRPHLRFPSGLVAAGCLALLLGAPATRAAEVPPPGQVLVRKLQVTAASEGTTSGSVRLEAELRQIDVVAAVQSGALRLRVQDGAAVRVTIVPNGCRIAATKVACRSRANGLAMRLRLRTVAGVPTWELQLVAKHLSTAQAGAQRARSPLRVLVDGLGRDAVVNRLASCAPLGTRGLACGASRRPNVIVIVTDDQRWDSLGFMPTVSSRLVGEGMHFDNAFVSTPVCCPSRASFLTGLWAHNHGTLTISPPKGGAPKFIGPDASTMATWLRATGYRTGFFGKYLNSYYLIGPPTQPTWYIPPGWDRWRAMRAESYFDFEIVTETGLVQPYAGPENYSTDVLRDQILAFIDEAVAAGKPFLVHYTPFGPHAALNAVIPQPAPRHAGLFADLALPMGPSFEEVDVSDKPLAIRSLPLNDPLRVALSGLSYRVTAETLQSIDEAVAAILDRLDTLGVDQDTVIIYSSDNGFTFGEHRIHLQKLCEFEECLRVPMVLRAPGLAAPGATSPRLVQNIDVAPTVAALAGVVPPNLLDGRSVVPLLLGETAGWRTDLLFEQWRVLNSRQFVAVRTETWKFVEDRDTGEQELYDLVGDPYELENRAADPGYAGVRDTLRARAYTLFAAGPGDH